jgi:hypothetical protein
LKRRGFLTGLVGFVACAPAIVRVASIMPVWSTDPYPNIYGTLEFGPLIGGLGPIVRGGMVVGQWVGSDGEFSIGGINREPNEWWNSTGLWKSDPTMQMLLGGKRET